MIGGQRECQREAGAAVPCTLRCDGDGSKRKGTLNKISGLSSSERDFGCATDTEVFVLENYPDTIFFSTRRARTRKQALVFYSRWWLMVEVFFTWKP